MTKLNQPPMTAIRRKLDIHNPHHLFFQPYYRETPKAEWKPDSILLQEAIYVVNSKPHYNSTHEEILDYLDALGTLVLLNEADSRVRRPEMSDMTVEMNALRSMDVTPIELGGFKIQESLLAEPGVFLTKPLSIEEIIDIVEMVNDVILIGEGMKWLYGDQFIWPDDLGAAILTFKNCMREVNDNSIQTSTIIVDDKIETIIASDVLTVSNFCNLIEAERKTLAWVAPEHIEKLINFD